ncbi:MAG: type II toxin-antitoxin system HicB family antitoxin [Verrucomicrobia bacterium]|nr:type II toxin-antitoxin system HicB family antitoxin [Verrucomicrobiota bacterium]
MKSVKIVVEKHREGYVAHPLGLNGVIVGEGDTADQARADCQSAIRFDLETFGPEALDTESPVLEAFIAEGHD